MKYGMYSIRDQLVGYGSPMIKVNDDVAKRDFVILITQDEGTLLASQPQYFDLYKIGEFDLDSGKLTPLKDHELIITGLSVKQGEKDGI